MTTVQTTLRGKYVCQHTAVNPFVFTPAVSQLLMYSWSWCVVILMATKGGGRRLTVHAELYVSCSDRKINTVRDAEERKASLFEVRELQSGAERQTNHPVSEI